MVSKISFNSLKSWFFYCFLMISTMVFSQADVFEISRHGTVEQLQDIYHTNQQSITLKNEHGYTPLTLACYNGNLEVVKFLVTKIYDINDISKYGTPLMAAIYKGHTDIVKVLLEYKANADLQDENGETAGHYAVFFKKYDIIKLLVDAKVNFEIKNVRNQTAIDYAIMYKDEKINHLLNIL